MKFKTLEIHNLASIEDARLDFDQAPLGGSELFLITGKTGSGKSTLLDALCLALYDNTPRLHNSQLKGNVEEDPKEDNMGVNDPRNLLRRNTAEAWVRLSFVGNNGQAYEAEWSVARARKKVDGRLQDAKRILRRVEDGHCFDRKRDVESQIKEAIGLDFNQFCRTTLLAQGQFTKFLNSDDKDKASILEKITGVDVYTQIGKKVYECTKEKERAWERAQEQVQGVKPLTEEELVAMQAELLRLETEDRSLTQSRKEVENRLQWWKTQADLSQAEQGLQQGLEAARAAWKAPELEKSRQTVSQWNETLEVRGHLAEARQAQAEILDATENLQRQSLVYASCLASLQRLQETVAGEEAQRAALRTEAAAWEEKQGVIRQAQSLEGQLRIYDQGRLFISQKDKDIVALQAKIKDHWEGRYQAVQAAAADAAAKSEGAKKKVREAEEALEALGLSDLRREAAALTTRLADLSRATEKWEAFALAQAQRTLAEQEWAKLKTEREGLGEDLEALTPQAQAARTLAQERKRVMEQHATTVDQWAKQIRSKLQPGDACPVCLRPLSEALPEESVLDRLYAQKTADWKEAEEQAERLETQVLHLQNQWRVKDQLCQEKTEALTANRSVQEANEAVDRALAGLGLSAENGQPEALKSLQEAEGKRKAEVEEVLKQGEAKELALRALRKKADEALNLYNTQHETEEECRSFLEKKRNQVKEWSSLRSQKQGEVNRAEQEIVRLLEGSGTWMQDWRTAPEAFVLELKQTVKAQEARDERLQALALSIQEHQAQGQRVEGLLRRTLDLEPQWEALVASQAHKEEIEAACQKLQSAVSAYTYQRSQALQRQTEAQALVDKYVADHPQYSREVLQQLEAYRSADIQVLQRQIGEAQQAYAQAQTLWTNHKQQMSAHIQNKPQMEEREDRAALEVRMAQMETLQREGQQQAGALRQQLAADEEKKRSLKEFLEAADVCKGEFEKWSRLNTLIGSSNGDKFRMIAQSFVLESLLHAANDYMRTLAPRYTLQVQPGTFVIFIEDAYQGYTRRAVSTVSGGESFLVSLALALALSDIGNQLSVDTLFIDEGFGTLSGEALTQAIDTLRSLHSRLGRHVGIISHVEELQERIPVQIRVDQEGHSSSSQVRVVG